MVTPAGVPVVLTKRVDGTTRVFRFPALQPGTKVTLEEPTKDMTTEAVSSGYYRSNLWQQDYPRIQILTVEELLDGKAVEMPKSVPFTMDSQNDQRIRSHRYFHG